MKFDKLISWRLTVFLKTETRNSNRNTIYLSSKELINCGEGQVWFPIGGKIVKDKFKTDYLSPKIYLYSRCLRWGLS